MQHRRLPTIYSAMNLKKPKFDAASFRFEGGRTRLSLRDTPTRIEPFYRDEADRTRQLDALTARIDQRQNEMHADEHYGLLVLFQAMDAGGKDSSIRHVFSGVNPSRFRVGEFKKPSKQDLAHDFLWRFWKELPERGYIGIFNRTYYEEVLVEKVHRERLTESSLPPNLVANPDELWKERYLDIRNFEDYLFRNGFLLIKIYLHVDKQEQGQRLINRLRDTEKQWKLSESDLEERQHWDEYIQAYEEAINATATKRCPWYIIPSDDRANQQLIIARIVTEVLDSLPIEFPTRDDKEARRLIREIERQDK